jgi:hypothetical protein
LYAVVCHYKAWGCEAQRKCGGIQKGEKTAVAQGVRVVRCDVCAVCCVCVVCVCVCVRACVRVRVHVCCT